MKRLLRFLKYYYYPLLFASPWIKKFAIAEEDTDDFPTPPISACKYSQLRFSHIDDIFGACATEEGGGVGTDSFWKEGEGSSESIANAYQRAAWEYTVLHGWKMAESLTRAGISSVQTDTMSAIGDKEVKDSDGLTESVKAAYPFLVCSLTEIASSGYDNLRELLPLIGAVSSDVVVLSNKPNESCFLLSTTAPAARRVAVSRTDFIVLPMTDVMKLDSGIMQDVCLNDEWIVPAYPSAHEEMKQEEKTWERKIRVGLRPGLGGTEQKVIELANQMLAEIRSMGNEGNRRRKLLRQGENMEDIEANFGEVGGGSITEAFSATTSKMVKSGYGRDLAEDSPHLKFWTRALKEGIESDSGCVEMFEALLIEARFNNVGFDILLNPLRGQNYANNAGSSASSSDCLCSLIAALSVHPYTLEVSANRPIELHNIQAQHLVQSGRPVAQTPFFDVGLTGKGQIVSVSDTGLSMNHCYFKNDSADNKGNIFDGNWDMSARKIVNYDNTYGDDYDAYAGHGTHVAGTVAGVVLPGSTGYDPGSGIAKDAKIAFFDMAIASKSVYDPGVARLFSSFYNDGLGASITIGSWGRNYQSKYSQECQDLDAALHLHDDVLYVASSGNDGDSGQVQTIKNPADCKNSLAVGASQSYGSAIKSNDLGPNYMASFSARGPTADGRTKPDVVAPGYMINSAISNPTSTFSCAFSKWAGTSMSAPVVAGSAALVRQYFVEGWYPGGFKGSDEGFEPSGSLVKAVLMNGGQLLKGVQRVPNGQVLRSTRFYDNNQNMGVINLMKSLPLFRYNQINALVVNSDVISRDATYTYELDVTNCPQGVNQIGVTLAWYDPAPASNCQNCIVNNLDLMVKTPSGELKHPNGLSQPDAKNNAERIKFNAAQVGKYQVMVNATNMATSTQRFSLIATGCFSYDASHPVQKIARNDFFLDTLWSGGLKSGGSMFGIVAKTDINITSFEIHSTMKAADGNMVLELYEIDGTHIGYENDKEKWRELAATVIIEGNGRGEATRIPEGSFPKIQMKKGDKKGIYITMKFREELRYTAVTQQMGEVFSQNADMQILVGSGNSYDGVGFGEFYPQRMFNGRVIYEKIPSDGNILKESITSNNNGASTVGAPALSPSSPRIFLDTLWNGGIKNSGSMFDVVAKTNIHIDSIQVNSPYTGIIHFEVYKCVQSHQGREMQSEEWSLVAAAQVQGGGEGKPTAIPPEAFFEELIILESYTVGIYVTMKYQFELRYSPVQSAVGDVFVENSDVAILVGTGNDYPFGNYYSKRMFNGAIGYKKIATQPIISEEANNVVPSPMPMPTVTLRTSQPSNAPTPSPSIQPTFPPSSIPTLVPTPLPSLSPTTLKPTEDPTVETLSLETLWAGGVKNSGAMFDVVAKSDIRITSFHVNVPSTDLIAFEIHTIAGGHQGSEQMPDRWGLVATAEVAGAGEGLPTVIEEEFFDQQITIFARQTMGFYITMKNKTELRYTAFNEFQVGDIYVGNLDLFILVGTGNGYPFGNFWPQRVINGAVHYERLSENRVADVAPVQAGVPFTSITWDLEESGVNSLHGWSVWNNGFMVRFTVEDSYVCPNGTNTMTQSGQATAIISLSSQTPLYFSLGGIGEQFETGYELLTFEIDGAIVAKATSEALGIECSAGPVAVTNEVSSPYFLSPGRHQLSLKFTTRDGFDHVGVHYDLILGFEP